MQLLTILSLPQWDATMISVHTAILHCPLSKLTGPSIEVTLPCSLSQLLSLHRLAQLMFLSALRSYQLLQLYLVTCTCAAMQITTC